MFFLPLTQFSLPPCEVLGLPEMNARSVANCRGFEIEPLFKKKPAAWVREAAKFKRWARMWSNIPRAMSMILKGKSP